MNKSKKLVWIGTVYKDKSVYFKWLCGSFTIVKYGYSKINGCLTKQNIYMVYDVNSKRVNDINKPFLTLREAMNIC